MPYGVLSFLRGDHRTDERGSAHMAVCTALVQYAGVQIYFVSLPGWFVAAVLYVVLSKLYQKKVHSSGAAKAVTAA